MEVRNVPMVGDALDEETPGTVRFVVALARRVFTYSLGFTSYAQNPGFRSVQVGRSPCMTFQQRRGCSLSSNNI